MVTVVSRKHGRSPLVDLAVGPAAAAKAFTDPDSACLLDAGAWIPLSLDTTDRWRNAAHNHTNWGDSPMLEAAQLSEIGRIVALILSVVAISAAAFTLVQKQPLGLGGVVLCGTGLVCIALAIQSPIRIAITPDGGVVADLTQLREDVDRTAQAVTDAAATLGRTAAAVDTVRVTQAEIQSELRTVAEASNAAVLAADFQQLAAQVAAVNDTVSTGTATLTTDFDEINRQIEALQSSQAALTATFAASRPQGYVMVSDQNPILQQWLEDSQSTDFSDAIEQWMNNQGADTTLGERTASPDGPRIIMPLEQYLGRPTLPNR